MYVGDAPASVETPIQRFRRIAESARTSDKMTIVVPGRGGGKIIDNVAESFSPAEVDLLLGALEQGTDWRAEYVRARDAHNRMVEALKVCQDERDEAKREVNDLLKANSLLLKANVDRQQESERLTTELDHTREELALAKEKQGEWAEKWMRSREEAERLKAGKPRMQYILDEDMLRLILSR